MSLSKAAELFRETNSDCKVYKEHINAYETIPATYKNGKKNAGRKAPIDFLLTACDVYGVTMDYLVGRSDVPAPDLETEDITEKTGLSIEAVKSLIFGIKVREHNESKYSLPPFCYNSIYEKNRLRFLNEFLTSKQLGDIDTNITDYIEYIKKLEYIKANNPKEKFKDNRFSCNTLYIGKDIEIQGRFDETRKEVDFSFFKTVELFKIFLEHIENDTVSNFDLEEYKAKLEYEEQERQKTKKANERIMKKYNKNKNEQED